MGYSTSFDGVLKFTSEPTTKELAKLKTFLGEDCRDHSEWDSGDLTYIDLQFTDDFSGLKWDGSEKTYELVEKVNFILDEMRKDFPHFGLSGELIAQGEDSSDRWILAIEKGKAVEKKIILKGKKITCPCCGEEIIITTEEYKNAEKYDNSKN